MVIDVVSRSEIRKMNFLNSRRISLGVVCVKNLSVEFECCASLKNSLSLLIPLIYQEVKAPAAVRSAQNKAIKQR